MLPAGSKLDREMLVELPGDKEVEDAEDTADHDTDTAEQAAS